MSEEAQRTGGGDGGVLLAQRSGGGVARIGEDLAARLASLPRVERGEIGLGHVDLAAHLEHRRARCGMRCGMSGIVRDIGGHVFADGAVAPRRGKHQLAAARSEASSTARRSWARRSARTGSSVGKVQEAADARDELDHLLVGKGVVEAEHRPRMGDFGERAPVGAAPSRFEGESARTSCGNSRLQLAVFADQRVIVGVGNLRRVVGRGRACRGARSPSPAASGDRRRRLR